MKLPLSFYTNIPSPYNSNLFESLSDYFNLNVIYYSKLEKGRQWDININHNNYKQTQLKNNLIGKLIQKLIPEFHFSKNIISQALNDHSTSIILSGNYFSANTYIELFISIYKRKRIYWFGEKLLPSNNKLKNSLKLFLLKPILNNVKGIFCVGNQAIKSYKNAGYKGPCFNTPYSIDSSNFYKSNLNKKKFELLKEKLNPNNDLIILTSGSLIQRKGIDIVIKTYLRIIQSINKNISLFILGDGPLKHDLKKMSESSDKIFFHGFIQPDELSYYFNMADIFLFCSRYDGWAVVINEAIASGLPIIVSDEVSASELIINDINGYVCQSENVDLFYNSLYKLINSLDLRSKMKIENYKLSENISSTKIANIFYNEIIKHV